MKINKLLAIFAGLTLVLASCTDLSETPYDFITDDNIDFTDTEQVSELSGNVYSYLRKTFWTYYGMWDWTEDASDLHMFPTRIGVGWGDYYCAYHKHEFAASYENINYVIWYHSYVAIMYANMCLGNEGFVKAQPQATAELRALRAYLYYILFDSYRNIPILPEGEVEAGYLPPQVTPTEAFDYIVTELEECVEDLPETNDFGYPTKYMAYMTLAKMHLNYYAWFADKEPYDEGDKSHYEEALKYADKIISSGKYSLSATYAENHVQDLSSNKEVIFGIDLDSTEATGCYLSAVNLPSFGIEAFNYTGGAWNGGCAIPQFIDTYAHTTTTANSSNHKTGVLYYDSRFYDTWAYGQQYKYGTNNKVSLSANVDSQGTVPVYYTKEVHSIDNPGAYMMEGYRYIKSQIVEGDKGTFGNDTPVYRLADAYFIAAECALRLGGSSKLPKYTEAYAVELVNKVRARAFTDYPEYADRTLADLQGGSCYDYGIREYTNANPESPAFSYEKVWNDAEFNKTLEGGDDIEFGGLLDDLAWEFVGEFHRRQDLIRFRCGNGQNVWNGKSWFCKPAETKGDFHKNLYPISQDNMESNRALVQNPGY